MGWAVGWDGLGVGLAWGMGCGVEVGLNGAVGLSGVAWGLAVDWGGVRGVGDVVSGVVEMQLWDFGSLVVVVSVQCQSYCLEGLGLLGWDV